MSRIYSNGPKGDFVINPFSQLAQKSSRLHLAAPYFTDADPLLEALQAGKGVQLIIGLNEATSPAALRRIHNKPGMAIRYFTSRFHAKIFIFDSAALLGSANLTDGGLRSNREAVARLDRDDNPNDFEDARGLFVEFWDSAMVLTDATLAAFEKAHADWKRRNPNSDKEFEDKIGQSQPSNISVNSRKASKERVFLEALRREVYEQYRPAFAEVSSVIEELGFRRPELANLGTANETNRFLNYVRLSHVIGDDAWQNAPMLGPEERRNRIIHFGREWVEASDSLVPEDYAGWLTIAKKVFGTPESIELSSKEEITQGLLSLHAFSEQLRFVKGGLKSLPHEFWRANNDDLVRVKSSLRYLVHGEGDFILRFHDVLFDPKIKLGRFAYFCALELYGTVKPEECPPMNGRMAKALRFLGFDVKGG